MKKTKSNDFKEKRSEKSTDIGSNTDESEKLSYNTIHFNSVKKKSKNLVHNHAKLNLKLGDIIGQGIYKNNLSSLIYIKGAYGEVRKAINLDTGNFVAVKNIKINEQYSNSASHLEGLCKIKSIFFDIII